MAGTTQKQIEHLDDRELIKQFHQQGDEQAFALIVDRHGPMVLRVCRKTLQSEQDAEDAFQAVFMVLARKAGSVRWQKCLANWLYGVAFRISLKARSQMHKRLDSPSRSKELDKELPETKSRREEFSDDSERILYEEIERLPAKLKAPILLCLIEGQSRKQAARSLDLKESTLKGRLERGREILRSRMLKREVVLPATIFTHGLISQVSEAGFSSILHFSPVDVAAKSLPDALAGSTSMKLAQGELTKMFLITQFKVAAAVLSVAVSVGTGSFLIQKNSPEEKTADENTPKVITPLTVREEKPNIHQQLIGSWKAVTGKFGKKYEPHEMKKGLVMKFTNESVTVSSVGSSKEAGYRLDLSHKPFWFDIVEKSENRNGQKTKEIVNRAIFELKGDELKICLNASPNGKRPEKFSVEEGTAISYTNFKRVENPSLSEARKKLIGEWKIVSLEDGGRIAPDDFLKNARMYFTESHFTLSDGSTKWGDRYTIATGEEDFEIDVYVLDVDDPPRESETGVLNQDEVRRGIFQFSDDELKFCLNESKNGLRPSKFVSEPNNSPNDLYIVARKIKK